MKLSRSILAAHIAVREKPKNLRPEDLPLFEHEFRKKIDPVELFQLSNISIIKNVIFSPARLKFYTSLSNLFTVPKMKLIRKLWLFFLPFNKIENAIWISDEWSIDYFHWLTDALPRLIVVEELMAKDTVILPDSFKTKSYIGESLDLLGFKAYYNNYKRRLAVKQLHAASHIAPTGNFNKQVIGRLRDRFISKETMPFRKIYISREKATKRKITNEAAVIELVSVYGYEIHFFEDYDLKKQIEIMSQTKSLLGLHGAGLTNMLFMPCNGQVFELRNENDAHNNCYFSLASDLDHEYYYLLNTGDIEDTHRVEITVDISKLKTVIELMHPVIH